LYFGFVCGFIIISIIIIIIVRANVLYYAYIITIPALQCERNCCALTSKRSRTQKSGENYEDIKLTLIRFKVFQSIARHDNVL